MYWKADEIVWNNFFAHYFVVFFVHYVNMLFSEENERMIPERTYWKQMRSHFNLEGLIQKFFRHLKCDARQNICHGK